MRSFVLVITVLLAGSLRSVRADETLVLDLPTGEEYAAAQSGQTQRAQSPDRRTGSLPSRHTNPRQDPNRGEQVVGRLGVTSAAAPIYQQTTTRSRMLARVEPGTYLAICRAVTGWHGVLMSDQTVGWVPVQTVRMLDYEVVGPKGSASTPRPGLNNPLLTAGQRQILQTAYTYLGIPYKWGGTSPNAMDCSAFVQRCFASLGLSLPRTAREQYVCGMPVSIAQLQAADRLYFQNKSGRITHTGIYIGDGYFIHSSSSRKGVAVSRLDEPLYAGMYAGARR